MYVILSFPVAGPAFHTVGDIWTYHSNNLNIEKLKILIFVFFKIRWSRNLKCFKPRRGSRRGYSATRSVIQRKSIQLNLSTFSRAYLFSQWVLVSLSDSWCRYSKMNEPIGDQQSKISDIFKIRFYLTNGWILCEISKLDFPQLFFFPSVAHNPFSPQCEVIILPDLPDHPFELQNWFTFEYRLHVFKQLLELEQPWHVQMTKMTTTGVTSRFFAQFRKK